MPLASVDWLRSGPGVRFEVVGHPLQRQHRVDAFDVDAVRHVGGHGGVIEDGPDSAAHQLVDDVLGGLGGHGHDAHVYGTTAERLLQVCCVPDQ